MVNLKKFVGGIPVIGPIARKVRSVVYRFPGSESYWEQRYSSGGNSGAGSYGKLAEFKSKVLNSFIRENGIKSIIEYGCGDGNQLRSADYPQYLGFDVSSAAISMCRSMFDTDPTKQFRLAGEYAGEMAELTLSLDVIYHLVEDHVFESYMRRLFESSTRFVIIYSSNADVPFVPEVPHVRHRRFATWIETNASEWTLDRHIPNEFSVEVGSQNGAFADFYVYSRHGRGKHAGSASGRNIPPSLS